MTKILYINIYIIKKTGGKYHFFNIRIIKKYQHYIYLNKLIQSMQNTNDIHLSLPSFHLSTAPAQACIFFCNIPVATLQLLYIFTQTDLVHLGSTVCKAEFPPFVPTLLKDSLKVYKVLQSLSRFSEDNNSPQALRQSQQRQDSRDQQ